MRPLTPCSSPRHVVIRASAGTGKTYQLVIQYLWQLRQAGQVDRLLATTFTRKAAGEILERVLLRLARASLDDGECRRLAEQMEDAAFTPDSALGLLRNFTRQLHRVRIGTLDSFFSRLATAETLELGLPPGWEILDDQRDRGLRRQAVAAILHAAGRSGVTRLMKMLAKGDATRSVTRLMYDTVEKFYDLYRQTDASAWTWFPEPPPLLSADELRSTIGTLKTAEVETEMLGKRLRDDSRVAEENDWEAFLTSRLVTNILAEDARFAGKPVPEPVRRLYDLLIGHARAVLVRQLTQQTRATYELLACFDAEYRRLKHETRGLRFDDITETLAEAHSGDQSRPWAYRLDGDVSHLLLDEFQDTSLSQWRVLRPLAERITGQGAGGRGQGAGVRSQGAEADRTRCMTPDFPTSFFCVGDAKQAIYGWRGGMSELFDAIDEQLPGLKQQRLTHSRRSSPVIIETVNRLFTHMTGHPDLGEDELAVRAWCDRFCTHTTEKRALPGYVRLVTAPAEEKTGEGDMPAAIRFAAGEVRDIAGCSGRASIGVLMRRNKAVRQMIAELRRLNVPASEEGGNPLKDSAAVQLLQSLLWLADHPGDTVARYHVAKSPLGERLGYRDHADHDASESLAESVRRKLMDSGYGPAMDEWARLLAPHCSRRELKRLGQLVELAASYQPQATLRPADFVRFVEAESVADPTGDRVRVMTIHQAKGLEFDVVVLPELDWSPTIPTPPFVTSSPRRAEAPNRVCLYRSREIQRVLPAEYQELFRQTRDKSVTEALCLLYVAMTRAVHALHLVIAPSPQNERRLPGTIAGLLRAGLTSGQPLREGAVAYESGDADWWRRGIPEAPSAAAQPPRPQCLSIRLAEMPSGRRRGLSRVSPSHLDEGPRSVRLAHLLRTDTQQALQRGTLFHAWFEQIEWPEDRRPDEPMLRRIAARLDVGSLDVDQCLAEFDEMLRRRDIAGCLTRDSYRDPSALSVDQPVRDELAAGPLSPVVLREQSIAVRREGELLTGTIDRLVLLLRDGRLLAADILDFKTDRVTAEDLAGPEGTGERWDHYRAQLRAYVSAVSRVYDLGRERISARLLFVEPGVVVGV